MNSKKMLVLFLLPIVFAILGLFWGGKKLTYIEYTFINEQGDNGDIELKNTGDTLVQEFIMPYDLMHGFALKIGTHARDNNSKWKYWIEEKESGRIVYSDVFDASLIADNEFHIFEFKNNIRIKNGHIYKLCIMADSVNEKTGLAFYMTDENDVNSTRMFLNNDEVFGTLCCRVYGGDNDPWWIAFALLMSIVLLCVVSRIYYVHMKGGKFIEDKLTCAMLTGMCFFLLLCTFAVSAPFSDEYDNIYGGMVIGKGGVLYRDYVTQHTPVTYYLCAIFSILGAGSLEQFRLSYYVFEALIWALIYYRHVDFLGKKMMLLPALEAILIPTIIHPEGVQILSDGIQGLCTVILVLEFIRYYADRKLSWDRCFIVSLCIWASFGAAFVSAYAIIWIVLAVIVVEIGYLVSNHVTFGKVTRRYGFLFGSLVIPLIGAVIYFKINHSLKRAFEQFYVFNRVVYPKYVSGLGEKIFQPFIYALQNFFVLIKDGINAIIAFKATSQTIIQLIIVTLVIMALISLILKKRIIEAFVSFAVLCCSATRGYGFHGLAAWYLAITLLVIFCGEIRQLFPKVYVSLYCAILVLAFNIYIINVSNNLLYRQGYITEMDNYVIEATQNGERIMIDAYSLDAIQGNSAYFLYKNRYPMNRTVYILPWYMDWYEQDLIDDLNNNQPNIVIYNANQNVWGNMHYANVFESELREKYVQLSEDPSEIWRSMIWIRSECP